MKKSLPYLLIVILFSLFSSLMAQTRIDEHNAPLLVVDGKIQPYTMIRDTSQIKPADINNITVLKDSAAKARYGSKGINGVILIETKIGAAKMDSAIKSGKPLNVVEVMPQFPGGEEALMSFIKQNLRYPIWDAKQGLEGRVILRFVVNKTGKVSDIEVIRGVSPGCNTEAIRVVKMMPDWKPGTQKGIPVNVYYTLPIVYKLQR
ncbi:MAG TPA: TonB family protein [Bacteroidales bacterium]|nr:TonB family protein [Bacteroidales bacterium]